MNLGEDMNGTQPNAGIVNGYPVGYSTAFPVSIARGASFDVDLVAMARALGCDARAVADETGLAVALDEVVPGLRERPSPLLLEVAVEPD